MRTRRSIRRALGGLALGGFLPALAYAADAEPDSTAKPPEPPRPRPTMHAPT